MLEIQTNIAMTALLIEEGKKWLLLENQICQK